MLDTFSTYAAPSQTHTDHGEDRSPPPGHSRQTAATTLHRENREHQETSAQPLSEHHEPWQFYGMNTHRELGTSSMQSPTLPMGHHAGLPHTPFPFLPPLRPRSSSACFQFL